MIGLLLMASAPTAALAGVMFNNVWFPGGVIQFEWFESPAPSRSNLDLAFGYVNDHTPLVLSPTRIKGSRKLALRWSGAEGRNVTRGYWMPEGSLGITGLYGKSLAFSKDSNTPPSAPDIETIIHELGHGLGFAHEFQRDDRLNFMVPNGATLNPLDVWNFGWLSNLFFRGNGYRNLSPFDHGSVMTNCYIKNPNDPGHCGNGFFDLSRSRVEFLTQPSKPAREYKVFEKSSDPSIGLKEETRTNLMSVHDINSIYRVYATALGENEEGDEFGQSVATGDFDDDGHEDIAVAANEDGKLMVYLFRGVSLAVEPGTDAIDLHHIPWLSYSLDLTEDPNRSTALAAGDFNGDQIDDLAVGDPEFDNDSGRVFVAFFNQVPKGESGACGTGTMACAPWGERSALGHHVILPEDVGLKSGESHRFGAALAVADVTKRRHNESELEESELEQGGAEDLLIGAPGAFSPDPIQPGWFVDGIETGMVVSHPDLGATDGTPGGFDWNGESGGAVVIVRPNIMASIRDTPTSLTLNWSVFDSRIIWNPGSSGAEFGAAIGRIPSFCKSAEDGDGVPLDGFAVGAPGEGSSAGAVYYYDCATDYHGNWMTPLVETGSRLHPTPAHRYGESIEGFEINEMSILGCGRSHYIVAGAPYHTAPESSLLSGRVYVHSVDDAGTMNQETTLRPVSTVSGDDLFGAALGVHQQPSEQCTDEAGNPVGGPHVEIAVGMPGNTIEGNSDMGRVYIWNPWNADGSVNHSSAIERPLPLPGTRLGQSIATIRNLSKGGGFALGAPGGSDSLGFNSDNMIVLIQSGIVWTLLNEDFSDNFGWSSYGRVLSQATRGDSRPKNLTPKCGLGFEGALAIPLILIGRGGLRRRKARRPKPPGCQS
jgi:hypothetical protein